MTSSLPTGTGGLAKKKNAWCRMMKLQRGLFHSSNFKVAKADIKSLEGYDSFEGYDGFDDGESRNTIDLISFTGSSLCLREAKCSSQFRVLKFLPNKSPGFQLRELECSFLGVQPGELEAQLISLESVNVSMKYRRGKLNTIEHGHEMLL